MASRARDSCNASRARQAVVVTLRVPVGCDASRRGLHFQRVSTRLTRAYLHTASPSSGNPEYVPEPFDNFHDENMRQKWLEEKKVLAGPFVPSGAKVC